MNNRCREHTADSLAASRHGCAVERKPTHANFRVIGALVVAVSSAVGLAAFDKPMDRSSFVPSVLEVSTEQSDVKPLTVEQPKAHAMLLRYEFPAPQGTVWQAGTPGPTAGFGRRAQPLLL